MNDYKILGIPLPKYNHVYLNNVTFYVYGFHSGW